ncbi:MAG: hypothetical protein Fur0028_13130 [Bacteroidales bacterium]
MKEIKKIIFLFMLVLYFQASFAQYNYLQINLEIETQKKKNHHTRFSLYQDSLFYIGIKNNPIIYNDKPETWLKRDFDTIIKIRKEDFNKIAEMSMSLSSFTILKGMNPSNPIIGNDGIVANLELVVTMDKISYSIWNPSSNTKERNLEPFLAICKEILLLAKMKPKDYF